MPPALFVAGFLSAILLGAIVALNLLRAQARVDAELVQRTLLALLQLRVPGIRKAELGPIDPAEGVCTVVIDGRAISVDTDGRVVAAWESLGRFPWERVEGRSERFFHDRGLGLHRLTQDPAFDDHYGVIAGPDGDIPVPERLIRLLSAEVELRPSVTAERVEVGPVEGPRPNLLAAMGSRGRLRRRISAILGGQPPSSATVEALQHTDQGLRYLGNRAARVLNLARALERAAASGWPEDESSTLRRRRG
jgi:hypothetical protein